VEKYLERFGRLSKLVLQRCPATRTGVGHRYLTHTKKKKKNQGWRKKKRIKVPSFLAPTSPGNRKKAKDKKG